MITSGVATAAGTVSATSLIRLPPGPATVLLAASAGTVYVGVYNSAGTLTTSNGFPVVAGAVPPVVFPVYPGNPGEQLACVVASGTASLSWIVTSATGGTGTGALG